jgi:hypothetical protein
LRAYIVGAISGKRTSPKEIHQKKDQLVFAIIHSNSFLAYVCHEAIAIYVFLSKNCPHPMSVKNLVRICISENAQNLKVIPLIMVMRSSHSFRELRKSSQDSRG